MNFGSYIDLHTHTTESDGLYAPEQLCALAQQANIGVLAITDHNFTQEQSHLQKMYPSIQMVQGAEISCLYTTRQGKEVEVHVVGLGFDVHSPEMLSALSKNQLNREPYINAILDRLRQCGIDLGCYQDLRRRDPEKRHIGRMDVARLMKARNYVETIDQAFDVYIGQYGEKKAYVPNPLRFISMDEAVKAILAAGGAAVLAHLYYYQLSDTENEQLVSDFKQLAGERGGMEVFYRRYNQEQRTALKQLADRYGLMYSAASDFHGQKEEDTLENKFDRDSCAELLSFLGIK